MMAESNIDDVKIVLRSILTSCPGIPTISQVLNDYEKMEGFPLPYKQLGFNTVYDLFKSMNDVLKMPNFPNMESPIKLILDEKSFHLRELVMNQKKPRKKVFKKNSSYFGSSGISSSRYNASQFNHNARGYDYVRKKSFSSSKPKGRVTNELHSNIVDLCNSSEPTGINVNEFKSFLIMHPDYAKLGTSNIQDAINMLKYFIYIARGRIYLKDSSFEIFSPKKSKIRNFSKSNEYIPNIVNDEEEISNCDIDYTDYDFDLTQDFNLSNEDSMTSNFNNLQFKNSDIIIHREKKENTLKTDSVLINKPLNNNIIPKIESKVNGESKNFSQSKMDYKKAIISIIATSQKQMTVNEVLDCFKIKYGYSFPFEQFSCRTCMDFFRLDPASFKLDNPFSTNSIITLEDIMIPIRETTIRKNFIKASILYDQTYLKKWNMKFVFKNDSSSIFKTSNHEKLEKNNDDTHCIKSVDKQIQIYDSEMVLESMKTKMRNILIKFESGILCNDFMDTYAKEYNSQFTFDEYGFKSMKDMAYKLPSVFYVKISGDDCILFHASRRNELDNENNLNDPSQYYKRIPKTVIHNLSLFFQNNCHGIKFDDLKTLYCNQYGRCYEPLKYGYSSERHMFESLNKMVEIKNDMVYTKEPFAYAYFLKREDNMNNKKDISVLMDNTFLMDYSGKDICNGKFKYPPFKLSNTGTSKQLIQVVVAEIYNPNSFYIHMASDVKTLEIFMNNLQEFYNEHGDLYKVSPELITPGLVCTTIFENGYLWHRAVITKIVDENYVSVLYVDYGTVEKVLKSSIRLLKSIFSNLPIQSLHCSLYDNRNSPQNYSQELSLFFADLVDGKLLEASMKHFIFKGIDKRMVITLYLNTNNNRISVNKLCLKQMANFPNTCEESIRRRMTEVLLNDDIVED